jgi:hypothetical protein
VERNPAQQLPEHLVDQLHRPGGSWHTSQATDAKHQVSSHTRDFGHPHDGRLGTHGQAVRHRRPLRSSSRRARGWSAAATKCLLQGR